MFFVRPAWAQAPLMTVWVNALAVAVLLSKTKRDFVVEFLKNGKAPSQVAIPKKQAS